MNDCCVNINELGINGDGLLTYVKQLKVCSNWGQYMWNFFNIN